MCHLICRLIFNKIKKEFYLTTKISIQKYSHSLQSDMWLLTSYIFKQNRLKSEILGLRFQI